MHEKAAPSHPPNRPCTLAVASSYPGKWRHAQKQDSLFAGGTRTCIHTPGASYLPENLTPDTITQALGDAQLVYFDGRLTETAVVLARAARKQGVPVLVEAERLRPNLEVLLGEADYVCTSAHFPEVCHTHLHIDSLM